jgi:hypothetical protein
MFCYDEKQGSCEMPHRDYRELYSPSLMERTFGKEIVLVP